MALSDGSGELITVVQLIRHGSRNPGKMFENILCTNPYDNPEELAQLTKKGKQEIYNLGRETREKYGNILGPKYSRKYFKVSSSGSDRTLMSAQLFAAGVYPPSRDEIWHDDINWHPIPVFEVPSYVLGVLPQRHIVPRYRNEIKEEDAQLFQKLKESDLLDNIAKNIGEEIPDYFTLMLVADTLVVAESHGVELAEWVHNVCTDPLHGFYKEYARRMINTPFRKRMYVGGFLREMVEHMEKKIIDRSTGPNLLVYFGHDASLVAFLDTLEIKDYKWPECGSAVTIELWKKQEEYVVNCYFSHSVSTEPSLMKLPGDVTECGFHSFKNMLKEFMLSTEDLFGKYLK